MCYKEFIAYQCGHRSVGVVRPCPLTTSGHNYPVCGLAPDKPHYAETMCAACERQLHSRWVLIREWEHRWLHERGVCGCEVAFPGLLYTPRVIGDTAAAEDTRSSSGLEKDALLAAEDKKLTPRATTPVESSHQGPPKTSQGELEKLTTIACASGDVRVPALFTEAVTQTGEHRVSVRLPGLYAAEWQADHRALHDAGKCSCPTTFAPFQPQIPDNELTVHDRETLRQWREMEDEHEKHAANLRGGGDQGDETMKRIAAIEEAFGKFTVEDEQPGTTDTPAASSSRDQTQIQPQLHNRPHNTRIPTHPRAQASGARAGKAGPLVLSTTPHPSCPLPARPTQTPAQTPSTAPTPSTPTTTTQATQTTALSLLPPAPIYPQHQAHYLQFIPAHPAYATAATHTDTIPFGAHPWASSAPLPGTIITHPSGSTTDAYLTQGPGPYRTPGMRFPPPAGSSSGATNTDISTGAGSAAAAAPAAPSGGSSTQQQGWYGYSGHGNYAGYDGYGGYGYGGYGGYGGGYAPFGDATIGQEAAEGYPLCGLPIGAGPEGTSHMPRWEECVLRRGASGLAITAGGEEGFDGGGEKEGEEDGYGEGYGQGREGSDQGGREGGHEDGQEGREVGHEDDYTGGQSGWEAEWADHGEGEWEDDEGEGYGRPSPPRRRHSAAT